MSAAAVTARPGSGARIPAAGPGPRFGRVLAAEWSKLTSLRAPAVVAVVTVAASWGLTFLSANGSSTDPGFEPLRSLADGVPLTQVGTLVLGVLVGTGEFSSGTFRTTFTAVPRRLPVLAAQALVTTVAALVVAVLAVGAAVLALVPAAGSRGMTLDLTWERTPEVLVGTVALLVGMALLGLALGALLRRPVPAVVAAVAVVLVLPLALLLSAQPGSDAVPGVEDAVTVAQGLDPVATAATLLPGVAGGLLTTPEGSGLDGAPDLGAVGGGLVLAVWVLVPLTAAAVRLRARDLR